MIKLSSNIHIIRYKFDSFFDQNPVSFSHFSVHFYDYMRTAIDYQTWFDKKQIHFHYYPEIFNNLPIDANEMQLLLNPESRIILAKNNYVEFVSGAEMITQIARLTKSKLFWVIE